jgi:predicted nucleic acid-binding protein
VTLFDAYALVALFGEEPAAGEVEQLLRSGGCRVGLLNLSEAVDVLGRIHQLEQAEVRLPIELLVETERLALVAPSAETAWRAAELRTAYYARSDWALSMADCFLLATADPDEEIATADPAVAAVARKERLAVRALPDSSGRRP